MRSTLPRVPRSSSVPRSIATALGTKSCSSPEEHALFAGFLPPMREKIVQFLAGHDLIFALGAAAFTYHVEGVGPHVPAGAALVQLIDDPNAAAWAASGTSA